MREAQSPPPRERWLCEAPGSSARGRRGFRGGESGVFVSF